MYKQGRAWDETKLQQAFSDDDVMEIKRIIVSGPGIEDHRAWSHTKSGVFSVRVSPLLVHICFWIWTKGLENTGAPTQPQIIITGVFLSLVPPPGFEFEYKSSLHTTRTDARSSVWRRMHTTPMSIYIGVKLLIDADVTWD